MKCPVLNFFPLISMRNPPKKTFAIETLFCYVLISRNTMIIVEVRI